MGAMFPSLLAMHAAQEADRNRPRCRVCGQYLDQTYPPNVGTLVVAVATLAVVLAGILWVAFTIIAWVDPYPNPNITLVQILKDQWAWVLNCLGRIK